MDLEAKIDGLFPTYVFNFDLSEKVDWKKLIPILDEEVDKRHVLEEEENAEKFKDPRLRFFAAKHIFRNFPETLPNRVFLHFHEKVSERIFSLEKKSFLTLPGAMEEADTISLEIEENIDNKSLLTQLNQYNIYIDFLNDYYKQRSPKPIRFDSNLSKKLFG